MRKFLIENLCDFSAFLLISYLTVERAEVSLQQDIFGINYLDDSWLAILQRKLVERK